MMKYFITIVFCVISLYGNAQSKITPQSFEMTFECGTITPDSAIQFYKSLNLSKFTYSKNNSSVTIAAECVFDSVLLSKLYAKGVLFEMYPLVKLPEPSPIYTSYELDEITANSILSSEYILQLKIPFICSKWEKEYVNSEESVYKYYMYNCSVQTIIENSDITSIIIGQNQQQTSTIQVGYSQVGQQKFYDYTKNHTNESIVFLISKSVFSAPTILEGINIPFAWISDDSKTKNKLFVWQLIAYPILDKVNVKSIDVK